MEATLIADRYRIVRRIAAGGMGVVYEAEHLETGRRIALKLMHTGAHFDSDSATWTARMRREAKAAGSLDTPHVVQVLDAGESTKGTYIAMELLKGLDLKALLKGTGPLAPDVAARIVAQACLGVAAAHARGVLHRDLKPGNLFLSVDELGGVTVKVLDFGIAKITRDEALTAITVTGQLIGTPTYVSPEQARGLSSVDERTDIWSLGVVLYKLLSGTTPHELSGSLTDYLITLCTVPALPLGARAPWVPERFARVAMRALEIERDARYPNARAMFDELEGLCPDLRLAERELVPIAERARPTSVTPPPEVAPLPTPPKSNRTALWGVALLLTLALGLSAGFFFGRREATAPAPSVEAPRRAAPPTATPAPSVPSPPGAPSASASFAVQPSAAPAPSAAPTARKEERAPRQPAPPPGRAPPAPSAKPKLEFETGFE